MLIYFAYVIVVVSCFAFTETVVGQCTPAMNSQIKADVETVLRTYSRYREQVTHIKIYAENCVLNIYGYDNYSDDREKIVRIANWVDNVVSVNSNSFVYPKPYPKDPAQVIVPNPDIVINGGCQPNMERCDDVCVPVGKCNWTKRKPPTSRGSGKSRKPSKHPKNKY